MYTDTGLQSDLYTGRMKQQWHKKSLFIFCTRVRQEYFDHWLIIFTSCHRFPFPSSLRGRTKVKRRLTTFFSVLPPSLTLTEHTDAMLSPDCVSIRDYLCCHSVSTVCVCSCRSILIEWHQTLFSPDLCAGTRPVSRKRPVNAGGVWQEGAGLLMEKKSNISQ